MAAPNPYASDPDLDFDPAAHWGNFPGPFAGRTFTGESVANYDPSGENFFSAKRGEASLQGVIDSKRLFAFMRWALGYNNMETTNPFRLQRTNPICHPRFPGLICDGVASRGYWPIQSFPPAGTSTHQGLKLSRHDDGFAFVATHRAGFGTSPHTFDHYAGYDKELVTLRFVPAPYRLLNDDPGDSNRREYHRNTIIDTEPRTELLTLSGFQLIYAEGGNNSPTPVPFTNAKGKVAPGELGQVMVKPDLVVRWHRVPEKFISTNTIPGQVDPTKILAGMGKVNKSDWLTYKKGTLLLSGARLVRSPWTLAAGGNAVTPPPTNLRESIFEYDIDFLMTYFNPEKGFHNNAAIVAATSIGTGTLGADTLGHNCLPYRGEPTGAVLAGDDKNAGKWFLATYSGLANYIGNSTSDSNAGSKCLFEYHDYDAMFSSAWA
jgi:hypothetical protein